MSITLKELFGLVAFVALILGIAAWVGFYCVPYWICVVECLTCSLGFVVLARSKWLHRFTAVTPTFWIVYFGRLAHVSLLFWLSRVMLQSGSFVYLAGMGQASVPFITYLHCGFLIICSVFCFRQPFSFRRAVTTAGICTSATLLIAVAMAIPTLRELELERAKYPPMTFDSRLAYEKSRAQANTNLRREAPLKAEPTLALERIDTLWVISGRSMFHVFLFSKAMDRFIRARPFGFAYPLPWKGMEPLISNAKTSIPPPLKDIPFGDEPRQLSGLELSLWKRRFSTIRKSYYGYVHDVSWSDFVHFESLGFRTNTVEMSPASLRQMGALSELVELQVSNRNATIGFMDHGFHTSPLDADPRSFARLSIIRLELVSLLRFDEPRVYVLDHLPRMDQLRQPDVKTRALDAFETESLKQLWTDEDVVVQENGDEIRMLGSLRAAKKCLECHSVQRSDLIGAFSYALHKKPVEKR